MCFFSSFVRSAFTCSSSTKMPLSTRPCNSSQMFLHRSASPAFGLIHATWPLKPFNLHTPASVLLRLPHLHSEVTSIPLAFTERVRDFSSLPLPFFLRRFRLLLPFPEGFRNTSPHCVPFRTVVKPVLPCAFLHLASFTLTVIRPIQSRKSFFCVQTVQTSFQKDLPGHIAMLFSPILPHFLLQKSQAWLEPCSFFQLSILVHGCPLLPLH